MPVRRRRGIYGENPEESQLLAQGEFPIPRAEFRTSFLSEVAWPIKLKTLPEFAPKVGYNWEVLNVRFPIGFQSESGSSKPPTNVEVKLAILVGSQPLFEFRQTIAKFLPPPPFTELTTTGYYNVFFAESPPVPLTIPGGQGVSMEVTIQGTFKKEGASDSNLFIFAGEEVTAKLEGGEFKKFVHAPVSSYLSYRYT